MRLRPCRQPLLQAAGQSWDPQNPMQRQGMMPNAITCTALISSCQNGNHPEQALELFKNMQRPTIKHRKGHHNNNRNTNNNHD